MNKNEKLWGIMLGLGPNMWSDNEIDYPSAHCAYSEIMAKKFDKQVWDEVLEFMVEAGMNMLLIDLGDGVKYKTHPEIGLQDAWTVEELKAELERIRKMGITPLPKLNFSTSHDAWLGEYGKMVSTQIYHQVCKDLIEEVIEIFEHPKYIHLGLDEESEINQREYSSVNCRHGKTLWNDINFLCECARAKGVTPWIWADYYASHYDEFVCNVQKDVLLSNWFYWRMEETPYYLFDDYIRNAYNAFASIDKDGYRQMPCGSNWYNAENIEELVEYCKKNLNQDNIDGFLVASWLPLIQRRKYGTLEGIDLLSWAKKAYDL